MKMLVFTKIMKGLSMLCLLVIVTSLIFGPELTTDKTISRIFVSVSLFLNYISLSISEENERRDLNNQ